MTFQIVPDIDYEVILGSDEMKNCVLFINYEHSLITFTDTKTQVENCNVINKETLQIKGFLNEDVNILPHSTIQTYLHAEMTTTDSEFRMKSLISLTVDKNVITVDNPKVKQSSKGFPCMINNFSSQPVKLAKNTHVVWLESRDTKTFSQSTSIKINEISQEVDIANIAQKNAKINRDSYTFKKMVSSVKKIKQQHPSQTMEYILNSHKDIKMKVAQLKLLSEIREFCQPSDINKTPQVNVITMINPTDYEYESQSSKCH